MLLRLILTRLYLFLILSGSATICQSTPLGRSVPGRFIVAYRNGAIPAAAEERAQAAGARLLRRHESLGVAILQAPAANADTVRVHLANDASIAAIVEDRVVTAHALAVRPVSHAAGGSTAGDALYNSAQGWAVRQVGGFGATATTGTQNGPWSATTGAGVRIAILDSGVDADHPDIAPNLALNLSEIDQSTVNGLPSPCDDGSPADQSGHGTWSASLAAGALGANTGLVAGVAPSATLLNIKVLQRMPSATTSPGDPTGCAAGEASGLLSWVLAGIADAVQNHADIISMSLGTLVDITTGDGAGLQVIFDEITHSASVAGVLLIASAGNDGYNLANQQYIELPAQSRDVLAVVAATNPACAENLAANATCAAGPVTLPYYSNFGAPLNALAAPGGSYPAGSNSDTTQPSGWIWGACSSGLPATVSGPPGMAGQSYGCFGLGHAAYVQAMGTSASAPLAAGAAALLMAAHPTWSATTVAAALRTSAQPMATLPVPEINVAGLLTPVSTPTPRAPVLIAHPQR